MVCKQYFDCWLVPGATMSDHSDGFRNAFTRVWPLSPFGQCWPHIKRKFHEGEYCKKDWAHFEDAAKHITSIHFAQSPGMKNILISTYGEVRTCLYTLAYLTSACIHLRTLHHVPCIHLSTELYIYCVPFCVQVWDTWGKQMDKFWNSYCINGWDNWSLGCFRYVPLCTPSQNTQESWHKQILQSKIPGMFKGSTEHCLAVAMPQLVRIDGIQLPDLLSFEVRTCCIQSCVHLRTLAYTRCTLAHTYMCTLMHTDCIPWCVQVPTVYRKLMEHALWYIDNQDTHIHRVPDPPDGVLAQWLVLRKGKGNSLVDKRITPRLVKQFMAAYKGMYAQGMRLSIHAVLTPNLCVRR